MSGWADQYIYKLLEGQTITFKPRGNSMSGRIESGQTVTLAPILAETIIEIDDIVLCRVSGSQYLHIVKSIEGDRYQIGNNKGHINGTTGRNNLYGKVIQIV